MGRRSTPTRTNPRNRRLSSAELKVQVDLLNPIFHDDNAAREYLEGILWPNGPHLPTVRGDWTTGDGYRVPQHGGCVSAGRERQRLRLAQISKVEEWSKG